PVLRAYGNASAPFGARYGARLCGADLRSLRLARRTRETPERGTALAEQAEPAWAGLPPKLVDSKRRTGGSRTEREDEPERGTLRRARVSHSLAHLSSRNRVLVRLSAG